MSALVCDLCGGKLIIGTGGTAVCDSCGIEHSLERVRQKYQELQNVVHVDNAHLINNYFALAQTAYSSDNKEDAEEYCNKILEIDSANADALFLKGKAVGWQSKIGSLRFKEAALCFAMAIVSATTDTNKLSMHENVQNEFGSLSAALIKLRCDRFSKWPDSEETSGFENDLNEISDAIALYVKKTSMTINKNHVFANVASIVKLCMMVVSTNIKIEYLSSGSRQSYSEFKSKSNRCIDIMKKSIDLCTDDDESDVQLYEQCISMISSLLKLNATDQIQNRWGAYADTPRLSTAEITQYQEKIEIFQSKIEKIKQ